MLEGKAQATPQAKTKAAQAKAAAKAEAKAQTKAAGKAKAKAKLSAKEPLTMAEVMQGKELLANQDASGLARMFKEKNAAAKVQKKSSTAKQ